MKEISRLHYITHDLSDRSHETLAEEALLAGVRWIQFRSKALARDEAQKAAGHLRSQTREYNATLIINDDVGLAIRCEADGVHLGKSDMPLLEARQLLGPEKIIGGTANTYADIERLAAQGADYVGLGPFRFTSTKDKLSPLLGLSGVFEILSRMKDNALPLPVIVIGGITAADVAEIVGAGAHGVAVSSAIHQAASPTASAKEIIDVVLRQKSFFT